jgi:hypothetical protein
MSEYKIALFHRRYDLPNDDGISIDDAVDIANDPSYWCIPVYGYDHSGFWISADIEPDWWHYAWDGGQIGIAYAKRGRKGVSTKQETAIEQLRDLVYAVAELDEY